MGSGARATSGPKPWGRRVSAGGGTRNIDPGTAGRSARWMVVPLSAIGAGRVSALASGRGPPAGGATTSVLGVSTNSGGPSRATRGADSAGVNTTGLMATAVRTAPVAVSGDSIVVVDRLARYGSFAATSTTSG